eukprot:6011322-Amphidinium_carterae.2
MTTNPEHVLRGGGLTPVGGMENTAGYKGYGLGMLVNGIASTSTLWHLLNIERNSRSPWDSRF